MLSTLSFALATAPINFKSIGSRESLRERSDSDNLSGGLLLGVIILHKREREHLFDRVLIGEEHGHAVDTHTPSTGRRQTILERCAEVLINKLSLVIALVLLARLLLETKTLVKGIVQLSVSVGNFLLADESLEALAETGDAAVVLGEGRHHLRVSGDEGRVDTLLLDPLTNELVKKTSVGLGGRAVDLVFSTKRLQEVVGLLGVELITRRELLAGNPLELGNHLNPPPGTLPVDVVDLARLCVVLGLVSTGDLLDHSGDEVFSDRHHVVGIAVGPVELASGELGVVGKIDSLVSELAANLVHTLETTHNQHLQVQLRRDTHEQIHVVLVVVSDERLSGGTTGNGVHHGGLDLDEIALVEVAADVRDDLGASDENVAAGVVHDEIEITLAVAGLLVLETEMLRGQHAQAGCEKNNLLGEDGELSLVVLSLGGSPAGETDDSDDISTVEVLVLGKVVANGLLRLGEDLDLDTLPTEIVEAELVAGRTLTVDTTSDADRNILSGLALLEVGMGGEDIGDLVGDLKLVGVRVGLLGLAELVD